MSKKIYGVSSKYEFSGWNHNVYVFDTKEEAEKWLNTEEYDSRSRELMNKTTAIKLAGRKAVDEATDYVAMQQFLHQAH